MQVRILIRVARETAVLEKTPHPLYMWAPGAVVLFIQRRAEHHHAFYDPVTLYHVAVKVIKHVAQPSLCIS